MTIPNTLYQSTIKLKPKISPITHPPFLQFQNVAFINNYMAQLLHLGLHGPFSLLFGIYLAIFWHVLLHQHFWLFLKILRLIVVCMGPEMLSGTIPRCGMGWRLVMDSDVNQLNLGTTVQTLTPLMFCSFWGGWLMVDHQAKVARMIFSCFWKRPTDCAIRISLMCCFMALLGNS